MVNKIKKQFLGPSSQYTYLEGWCEYIRPHSPVQVFLIMILGYTSPLFVASLAQGNDKSSH